MYLNDSYTRKTSLLVKTQDPLLVHRPSIDFSIQQESESGTPHSKKGHTMSKARGYRQSGNGHDLVKAKTFERSSNVVAPQMQLPSYPKVILNIDVSGLCPSADASTQVYSKGKGSYLLGWDIEASQHG